MQAPSAPEPSLKMKLDLLWATQKPLCILLLVILSIIFLGTIFAIVYFLIIKPHQTPAATVKAAHLAMNSVLHLRNMMN